MGQPADLIWNQLLDRLNQSSLQVDLSDPERGIIVASYSGDPAPYVTCGSILVSSGRELEQIAATDEASFDRVVRGRTFEVDRDLRLDARLMVQVRPDGRNAAVEATSNYVLTKTVVSGYRSGQLRGRTKEIVSFSTGGRGGFSKGTVCQPTGDLERTVLDILPRVTPVAGPARRTSPPPAPAEQAKIVATEMASDSPRQRQSECIIADKVFCDVLEITDPYRRANEERGLGLEVDAIEGGNLLLDGSDFGVDISLPSYDAYLVVSYFLDDGTVHHVLSGSDRRWPANAREFVSGPGLWAGGDGRVEMVVALASDVPVFGSPRPPSEAAEAYLAELRKRFAEMTDGAAPAQIAARLMVITPVQHEPS